MPHWPQNLVPGSFDAEQLGQITANGLPQLPQNLFPGGFSVLQASQVTGGTGYIQGPARSFGDRYDRRTFNELEETSWPPSRRSSIY